METEISRSIRHLAPAHYSLKVENFSLMSGIKRHETGVFEAGGFDWRLLFYPNGDKENDGEDHVSVYLKIVESHSLTVPWEVNVNFKLFVHNQILDNYLMIQDLSNGGVKRFHAMKTTWGFAQLLPRKAFEDSSNGYVVSDSCVFGAEVFVIKHTGKGESLSLVKAPTISNATFTWEIEKFSELGNDSYHSKVFMVGGRSWTLLIYPKGDTGKRGKSLSLFLVPSDWKGQIPLKAGLHADYKFRVIDQINGKNHEKEASSYFTAFEANGWGYDSLISLEELRKCSNGFIVEDSLTVEVEFVAVTEIKCFGCPLKEKLKNLNYLLFKRDKQ